MTNDRNDLVHTEAVDKQYLCSFSQIRTAKEKGRVGSRNCDGGGFTSGKNSCDER